MPPVRESVIDSADLTIACWGVGDTRTRTSRTIRSRPCQAKARVPHESEFTTVDYNIEERPFFIPIGKAGVIAALEKLDRQLLDVRIQYLVERVLNSSFYCRRTGQGCFQRRSPLTGLDVKLFQVKLV